jgi:hypothetical protein
MRPRLSKPRVEPTPTRTEMLHRHNDFDGRCGYARRPPTNKRHPSFLPFITYGMVLNLR